MGRRRKPPQYWQSLQATKQQPSCTNINVAAVQEDMNAGPMTQISLATQIERTDGSIASEVRRVSFEQIKQAQGIIARAVEADEVAQGKAIDAAISILYPYSAKPGQREALHHLLYRRKDLILIAGTGFGKSMILQAVSVLLQKSVTIVILPLDQIDNEQPDYIRKIGGIPCFLNRDTTYQAGHSYSDYSYRLMG